VSIEEMDYSVNKMHLREEALKILLKTFGDKYSNKSIYECADEWVEKGFKTTSGIVKYYEAYFSKRFL
tara:strand:- start:35 stop:238 length:204 start_codon:yes stop_codon:yes gene_type:complete